MYAAKKAAGAVSPYSMRGPSSSGTSTPIMSPGQDAMGYSLGSGGYDHQGGYDVGGMGYDPHQDLSS